MKDSTHIIIDSKLTAKDIRDSLWRCRDFELSHFWQRSVLLLTMMGIFIAAYGHIVIKLCDESSKYCEECINNIVFVYNNLAIVLCIINSLFSILWIMMAKGSKAWYERYEAAIDALENNDSYVNDEIKDKKIGGFKYANLDNYIKPEINNNIFNTSGGEFSPSRINIYIGQIAVILWTIGLIAHFLLAIFAFTIPLWIIKYGTSICILIYLYFIYQYWGDCFKLSSTNINMNIKSKELNKSENEATL